VSFQRDQKEAQIEYLAQSQFQGMVDIPARPYQLLSQFKHHNLSPDIRDAAVATFHHQNSNEEIKWHSHVGHGC
jgi:hypothetical protein